MANRSIIFGIDKSRFPYAGINGNRWGENFYLPMPTNVDYTASQIPAQLKFVLGYELRRAIRLRIECDREVSNGFIDNILNGWWANHHNQMNALSRNEGWDADNLCMVYTEEITRPLSHNFVKSDFHHFINCYYNSTRCYEYNANDGDWQCCFDAPCSYSHFNGRCVYGFTNFIFDYAFTYLLQGCYKENDSGYDEYNAFIKLEKVTDWKAAYNNNCFAEVNGNRRPKILSMFQDRFSFKIGSLARDIYNMFAVQVVDGVYQYRMTNRPFSSFDDMHTYIARDIFGNLNCVLVYEYLKYFGMLQTSSETEGATGPRVSTVLNKIIEYYFSVLYALRAAQIMERMAGQSVDAIASAVVSSDSDSCLVNACAESLDAVINHYKSVDLFTSAMEFKRFVCDENGVPVVDVDANGNEHHRFENVPFGTFEQFKDRLMTLMLGGTEPMTFFVSFHPCDLLTISLGHNWASCHNYYTNRRNYPLPDNVANGWYSGGSCSFGNFNYISSNAFVVYRVIDNCLPYWLQAKRIRILCWLNNNLTGIRMNYWYPSYQGSHHALDTVEKKMAKSVRMLIEDLCAPFNGTAGNSSWVCKAINSEEDGDGVLPFDACRYDCSYYMGYAYEPMSYCAYVKNAEWYDDIIFAGYVSTFNYVHEEATSPRELLSGCPVSVNYVSAIDKDGNACEGLEEYNCINICGRYFTSDWYKKYYSTIVATENGLETSSFVHYITSEGVFYCSVDSLPDNVHQCPTCGGYFSDDLLYHSENIHGECINCAIKNETLDAHDVSCLFIGGRVSVSGSYALRNSFFDRLSLFDDLRWSNNLPFSEYRPSSLFSKVYVSGGTVVVPTNMALTMPNIVLTDSLFGGTDNE